MGRKLGIFETATVLTDEYAPFNVVVAVSLQGGPSPARLRRALDRVQERHPLLGVRLVKKGKHYFFDHTAVPEIPLKVLRNEGPNHLKTIRDAELNTAFDTAAGPLIRSTLLEGEEAGAAHELVLTFHHAIVDSACAQSLIAEILESCAHSEEGTRTDPLPMLPPAEDLFPAPFRDARLALVLPGFMGRQMADEIRYRRLARGTRIPEVHASGLNRTLCRELSGEKLEKLVRANRRHRTTLHSALNAALLLAVRDRLHGGSTVPLRNFNFSLLRPLLTPRPDDQDLGPHVAMLRFTHLVGKDRGLWDLAREINAIITRTAKRGDNFLSLRLSATMMRMILRQNTMRMGSTGLAYTGHWPMPANFGNIGVRDIHAFVSNLVLGPEYTMQTRLFAGRLIWDIVFLDSDMDEATAAEVADHMVALLVEASADGTENP